MEHHFARLRTLGSLLLVSFSLAACASLSGSPVPVVSVNQSTSLAQQYAPDFALRAYHDDPLVEEVAGEGMDLRRGLSEQQYRDMVVNVYLSAIDSRYFEFRTALSSERREVGTGFDFAILGLTTLATTAQDSIRESLAAAASVMTGTRASLDRNLYFDRTLPSLLAAMEASRLRVLARITQNLGKNELEYPLETAFTDLRAYEMAASLDGAIGVITAEASELRQAAEAELATAVQACEVVDESAVTLNSRLSRFVHDLADSSKATATDSFATRTRDLQRIGVLAGLSPGLVIAAEPAQVDTLTRRRLLAGVNGRCAAGDYQLLIDRIKQETERDVP
jgi:hypothetical protein